MREKPVCYGCIGFQNITGRNTCILYLFYCYFKGTVHPKIPKVLFISLDRFGVSCLDLEREEAEFSTADIPKLDDSHQNDLD